jgi:glutamate--cysteine ligase
MQAIAGVHFNYSPPEALWPAWREWQRETASLSTFRSEALMGLVRNYYRSAWLVTYLFGASPALARSFLPAGNELLELHDSQTWFAPYATSLRMSDIGYQNKSQARLRISANSTDEYVQGLAEAVSTAEEKYERIGVKVAGEYRQLNANTLQIENEYYSTMRPKPPLGAHRTTVGLRDHGVQYVEVRTLDISPGDPVGLNQSQMRFLEVLLLYCLFSDAPPISAAEHAEISQRDLLTAREGRRPELQLPFDGQTATIPERIAAMRTPLLELAALLDDADQSYQDSVQAALQVCAEPELTPSARLLERLRSGGASFSEYGREVAASYRDYFLSIPLEAHKLTQQNQLAEESLRAAARLEAASTEPFAVYLAEFMQRV